MGPSAGLYIHPWIPEAYHTYDIHSVNIYYRYPESPEYGFFVEKRDDFVFHVGPVRFEDGIAIKSGEGQACYDHATITEYVEKMYLKNQAMGKVHSLEELLPSELAPF